MIYKGEGEPQTTFTPSQWAKIKHMENLIDELKLSNAKWQRDYERVLVEVLTLRAREDARQKEDIMDGSYNDIRVQYWHEGMNAVLSAFRASSTRWMLRHMTRIPLPECPYLYRTRRPC